MFYDERNDEVIAVRKVLILANVKEEEDIVFKASFIIANDISCDGTVTALFDLIVIGNIHCKKLDVKGTLICLGRCNVTEDLIVQNELWANEVWTSSLVCHERVVVQGMDADVIKVDGNIIVGKTLSIAERAETLQNIICGETAFGAGKLVARTIVTAEELDMDDGEESIESPYVFKPNSQGMPADDGLDEYISKNDYKGFIVKTRTLAGEDEYGAIDRASGVFEIMEECYPDHLADLNDVSLILWLIEMTNSPYFSKWPQISEWFSTVKEHFDAIIHGNADDNLSTPSQLNKGYVVRHDRYGRGIVKNLVRENGNTYVTISFDEAGEKKFPMPQSLKFFKLISEEENGATNPATNMLECKISGYEEFLCALTIVYASKDLIGDDLCKIIYDMLLSYIGLKYKYIQDRFVEKGWI